MDDVVTTTEQIPATLQSAIETAVEQHREGASEETQQTQETAQNADSDNNQQTQDAGNEGAGEDLDVEQAKQLFKALKDPQQAPLVIKFLAESAGYQRIETKTEAREAKQEIKDILREALGDEFSFLSDKLAPAIEKIITGKLEENTRDLRESMEQQELRRLESESDATFRGLAKEFFDADTLPTDFEQKLSKLMDKTPAQPGQTAKDYIEGVFYQLVGREGITKRGKTSDRMANNRKDVPSRLQSAGSSPGSSAKSGGPTKMSLDEAVKSAVEASRNS